MNDLRRVLGRLERAGRARVRTATRAALLRLARAEPTPEERAAADSRVVILLTTAWGMGGTIRAAFNVAGYLAGHFDVEIVSIGRGRAQPFFGAFPPGVRVVTLEDRRPSVLGGRLPLVQRLLRRFPSVLMHPHDRTYKGWNLWVDLRLVRHLRRRAGYVIGTRPGLNLLAADLALPGFVAIGEEQMHFAHHRPELRGAMKRAYRRLDALVVLTDRDRRTYEQRLDGPANVVRIPNAIGDLDGRRADLDAKVVLAAGRLSPQKGFDLLIDAWGRIAPAHPDWRLRLCGEGPLRDELAARIRDRGLSGSISFEGAARDLGAEMERASVFVLSSRFEGLPLILMEAMGRGMAVASFDCPTGPSDLIDDRVNGLLVPQGDVAALAGAIGDLLADAELRHRCGPAAVETARRYTMPVVGPMWDELLRGLAPAARRGPASAPPAPARR
jgi:glycosyltransferase involved in cell wall biosynthesis